MRTRVTELLGIEAPILQGGMAWCAESNLAAAVSEAGGLGIIGSGAAPAEWVLEQIRAVRQKTQKPFGVNIMLMNPHAAAIADIVAQEGVPVVTTGAGNPGAYIDRWKAAGVKVVPVIPSSALAKRMERMGADAVVAEGCEAGGHIGELTTMALVPQVVDSVSIPVIAAGGIADGRGFAAALLLGAQGVQLGTRFLSAHECIVHENYKQKLYQAGDTDTVVTGRSTGHPVRSLKSRFVRALRERELDGASPEEIERLGAGSLRSAAVEGDLEQGSFMAGQCAGLVRGGQSAKEIIDSLLAELEMLLPQYGRGCAL